MSVAAWSEPFPTVTTFTVFITDIIAKDATDINAIFQTKTTGVFVSLQHKQEKGYNESVVLELIIS